MNSRNMNNNREMRAAPVLSLKPAAIEKKEIEMPEIIAVKEKRALPEYNLVKMDDGREVEFAGKRRMLKESIIGEDGTVSVRLDFVNGESRTFVLPDSLLARFAGHGAEQKLGDEVAGLADVEDAVMAVD